MWVNLLFVLLLQVGIPTIPPSPTPIPTIPVNGTLEIPRSEFYNFMATAAANVNALPDDILQPGGVPILANSDTRQLFSYGKWMFSGNSVQELLGPTLSPFGVRVFVIISAAVTMVTIYFTLRFAALILKGVVWLVQQIRRLLPLG